MKKGTASTLFLCIFCMLNAQITLEKSYDFSATVVEFETIGYKYYLMDVPLAQCRIYNPDHSLFKTFGAGEKRYHFPV